MEESKKREIPVLSDDDSTVSVGTRVTIELDTSRALKPTRETYIHRNHPVTPMSAARRRKRPHVVQAAQCFKSKGRARRIPPSRDEATAPPAETQHAEKREQRKPLDLNVALASALEGISDACVHMKKACVRRPAAIDA